LYSIFSLFVPGNFFIDIRRTQTKIKKFKCLYIAQKESTYLKIVPCLENTNINIFCALMNYKKIVCRDNNMHIGRCLTIFFYKPLQSTVQELLNLCPYHNYKMIQFTTRNQYRS